MWGRVVTAMRNYAGRLARELRSEPAAEDLHALRRALEYLLLVRVVVLSSFLGLAAWQLFSRGGEANYAFWLIGLTFALSLVNIFFIRRSTLLTALGYAQLVCDVLLISVAVYISAATASTFLYLLVILGSALVFRRHGAVILAGLCGVAFTLLESGILPPLDGISRSMAPHEVLLSYFSFVLVALVGSHFTEKIRALTALADSRSQDITALESKQQQLFNDINEGILSLDDRNRILAVNSAARSILGISDEVAGLPAREVFEGRGIIGSERLLSAEGSGEVSLRVGQGEELHLNFTSRRGDNGSRVILFSDISRVRSIEEQLRLHERMTELLSQTTPDPGFHPSTSVLMVGESAIMRQVMTLVDRVARSEASVLVTGESGTGKELIARSIHDRSPRRGKPFVAVNCGAIPENLIESELFGHKKGAFTGAVTESIGLFRQASGGTIFLDEVGELPLNMQTKLLRVLQDHRVRAVGDVQDHPCDVRVVAATNRDLKKELLAGAFREDLYYRLNVVNIVVPPLRERREDIPLLVRHFLGQLCNKDLPLPRVSPEALQLLTNYPFPGNIRELENLIERALVLGGQAILPENLPEEFRSTAPIKPPSHAARNTEIIELPMDLDGELSRLERELILRALEKTGGYKKQAAELLGVNFRSFRYRLKKYGIGDDDGPEDRG